MSHVVQLEAGQAGELDLSAIPREVTEQDVEIFRRLVSTDLTEEQRRRILEPPRTYPRQRSVLAVHWHPEFVPMPLIRERIERMFPSRETELIIPTQHNVLMSYGDFSGVEVDTYSPSFDRKVQLLFHFANENLRGRDHVFRAMLDHTFKYRSSQLEEFIASLLEPELEDRVQEAAEDTGADEELVEFVRIHVRRLKAMIREFEDETPREMVKNKLIRNYLDELRPTYGDRLINHARVFVRSVKYIMKRHFSLNYFYETREVIEEARSLGAGVVIPHPEQFWPVLLDDLDIDGIEVWNPQSYQYTRFLVDVVKRENRKRGDGQAPLLVTMGDDCHMGEKVRDPRIQDDEKASREVGVQPAWDDLDIRKRLIVADQSRDTVIREYRERLAA